MLHIDSLPWINGKEKRAAHFSPTDSEKNSELTKLNLLSRAQGFRLCKNCGSFYKNLFKKQKILRIGRLRVQRGGYKVEALLTNVTLAMYLIESLF